MLQSKREDNTLLFYPRSPKRCCYTSHLPQELLLVCSLLDYLRDMVRQTHNELIPVSDVAGATGEDVCIVSGSFALPLRSVMF